MGQGRGEEGGREQERKEEVMAEKEREKGGRGREKGRRGEKGRRRKGEGYQIKQLLSTFQSIRRATVKTN